VVNEVYPSESCKYADVVLPCAMWVEREGQFGNAERHTAVFEKCVDAPGEAKWDAWIFMKVAEQVLAGQKIGDDDAFKHLFGTFWDSDKDDWVGDDRQVNELIWDEYRLWSNPGSVNSSRNAEAQAIAANADTAPGKDPATWVPMKMEAHQMAPYDEYLNQHGLNWPVRQKNGQWYSTKWRWSYGQQEDGYDEIGEAEYGKTGLNQDLCFYKAVGDKLSAVFRPYEPPYQSPSKDYPFWMCTGRLLEQWHSGTMTRRMQTLNDKLPAALLYMNADDITKLGVKSGAQVKVTTTYGTYTIACTNDDRIQPPSGVCFAPFFSEDNLVNLAVEDIYDPMSKEPDFKKTCARIEKA
jgi:nitrate reductase NapA